MDPKLWDMVRADPRFAYEAYEFVCDAVTFTQQRAAGPHGPDRHVSAAELLGGCVDLAREQFGQMAPVVFKHWGVTKTDDLGDLVFKLIDADKLSRSDRDDPADFVGVFDLPAALAEGADVTAAEYAPRRGER